MTDNVLDPVILNIASCNINITKQKGIENCRAGHTISAAEGVGAATFDRVSNIQILLHNSCGWGVTQYYQRVICRASLRIQSDHSRILTDV